MKKILFIAQHRPDRNPSQRFRYEEYLDFLAEKGYQCDHSYLLSEKDDKIFYQKGRYLAKLGILAKSLWKRWRDVRKASAYDFVFVQREAIMLGSAFFERRLSKKSKLIFDFDDAIWLPNVSSGNKPVAWLKRPQKTQRILKAAHLVIAGNQYLADYAKPFNPNVRIIPTTIATERYQCVPPASKTPDKRICIGWTGSPTTLPHFRAFEPVLKQVLDKYGERVYVKVIGGMGYVSPLLNNKSVSWTSETEVEELCELDIGIMPMPDNAWTRGKCACKGLQYMALGIPAVMSAVGVNRQLVQQGENGFLCETDEEWMAHLSSLIESAMLRQRIGAAGQETVLSNYSVQANTERFLAVFEEEGI